MVSAANNHNLSNDARQTALDAALTRISEAQTIVATNTGIAAPTAATNFLAISKDAVAIKSGSTNSKITIADFEGTGTSLKWPLVNSTELSLSLMRVGVPIVSTIEVAVDISQPSKSGALKAYISGLSASMSSAGLRIQSTSSTKMIF